VPGCFFFGAITYSSSLAGDVGVALIDLGINLIREILAYFLDAFLRNWFRVELSTEPDASITLSFSDVSDAYQFAPSPLRSSGHLDYRANPPHGRNTDISCT
jgi:hypothetical protein